MSSTNRPSHLFGSFERIDESPARHTESTYDFLNRVCSPWWAKVRDEIDQWFVGFPTKHQADLSARFRSPKRDQHWPAWWELYLFRLFTCLGYSIEVHPVLQSSSARPDFYIRGESSGFYVEALTVFSGIVEENRDPTREACVLDAINEVKSTAFSASIEFRRVGQQTPRLTKIVARVREWLDSLDPDAVSAELSDGIDPPALTLSPKDWLIVLEAFPIDSKFRNESPGRLIGVGPPSSGPVDDVVRLRAALLRKCKYYPALEEPLILAALSMSTFGDIKAFEQALLGSEAIQYTPGATGSRGWVRLRDSAWMTDRGPTGTNVSAALTASHLAPWQVTTKLPRLWLNPWADRPLEEPLPFPQALPEKNGAVRYLDSVGEAADIFALPSDWPGAEGSP